MMQKNQTSPAALIPLHRAARALETEDRLEEAAMKLPSGSHARLWRGILAIAFGLLAVSVATESGGALAFVFATYAMLDSIGALATALTLRNRFSFGIAILDALAGGYVLLVSPPEPVSLAHVIGAWAMATGILELFAAGAPRRNPEVRMRAAGVVSLLLGLILAIWPDMPLTSTAGWTGAMLLSFGCLCLVAAEHLRRRRKNGHRTAWRVRSA
jgi:uncharacterized membrane protein HdeD (DUF308 family)